ncbi:MAG: LicD family protein [Eubacterium sp.]|nr:LicD family protein [Eubacterium sp.]
MTGVQEKLMRLMDEVNEISAKHNLRYILANRTANRAMVNGEFVNETYEFLIFMPYADMLKFMEIVKEEKAQDRTIESILDNSKLRFNFIRYVDKNTLLIDTASGKFISKPGIAVTIIPMSPVQKNAAIEGRENCLFLLNMGFSIGMIRKLFVGYKIDQKRFAGRKALKNRIPNLREGIKAYKAGGRKRLAEDIFSYYVKNAQTNSDAYYYTAEDGKKIAIPKTYFEEVQEIEFEGRQFFVPKEWDKYGKILYDKGWQSDAVSGYAKADSVRVIFETNLPYEQYLAFIEGKGKSLESIVEDKTQYNLWMRSTFKPKEEKVNHTFLRVRRSVDRIDMWQSMKSKREALKDAYEKQDIKTLTELMKDYLKKTNDYCKKGIGFYIDDELFQYAKLIWEAQGKKKYADKVYQLVPDLYKNETVDEYMAARMR